jgi:multidrug efflux pump subunit AcrA (membrane-fusion protein)
MATNFLHTDLIATSKQWQLTAYQFIYRIDQHRSAKKWIGAILLSLLLSLFLPWTQNIRSKGTVTTLYQNQRPQQLNTVIAGKVKKWFIKEGDYVKAGDTIIQLSEIKDDYLDPALLQRTKEQIDAKQMSAESYKNKAGTAEQQVAALAIGKDLKIADLQNKIQQQLSKIKSDSIEQRAAVNDGNIKEAQFNRQKIMYDSGLVSLTQLEQRNQALQDALAKRTSTTIKYNNAQQEFLRLKIELNGEIQQYLEKISKAEGDKFQSISQAATADGEVAKLNNQYMNYDIRSKQYYIIAPQSGQLVQAKKAGIGEIVKEGELIVEIVPDQIQYAVEMYVQPLDLPLLQNGQKVRFMFDGFPAVVFSGWPKASYGTFGGVVFAIESKVSSNGLFKVLVKEDKKDRPWPTTLRMGTGASGMALLKNVMIGYELWRNINGFPPNFYTTTEAKEKK